MGNGRKTGPSPRDRRRIAAGLSNSLETKDRGMSPPDDLNASGNEDLIQIQNLFVSRDLYNEYLRARWCGDPEECIRWVRTVVIKQFAQLRRPEEQADFLIQYARLLPDFAAGHGWYQDRHPLIRNLETPKNPNPAEGPPNSPMKIGRRKRPKSKNARRREVHIRRAIKNGNKGLQYCRELDFNCVPVPKQWVENGCPNSHVEAYKVPYWRHRIHQEKSRLSHSLIKK